MRLFLLFRSSNTTMFQGMQWDGSSLRMGLTRDPNGKRGLYQATYMNLMVVPDNLIAHFQVVVALSQRVLPGGKDQGRIREGLEGIRRLGRRRVRSTGPKDLIRSLETAPPSRAFVRVIGTHTTTLTGQADLTSPLTVSADTSYSRLSSHSNTTSNLTASPTIFSSQCSSMTYPSL